MSTHDVTYDYENLEREILVALKSFRDGLLREDCADLLSDEADDFVKWRWDD